MKKKESFAKRSRKLMKYAASVVICLSLSLGILVFPYAEEAPTTDEYWNRTLLYEEDGRRLIGEFLTSFASIGMESFARTDASEDTYTRYVLKSFELYADTYESGVAVRTDEKGRQFLRVSAQQFEQQTGRLFHQQIPAENVQGYEDGYITVSAQHANGDVPLMAVTDTVVYLNNRLYEATFTVWQLSGEEGGTEAVYDPDRLSDDAKELTQGSCVFFYSGSTDQTQIDPWDLQLEGYRLNESVLPEALKEENGPITPYFVLADQRDDSTPSGKSGGAVDGSDDSTGAEDAESVSGRRAVVWALGLCVLLGALGWIGFTVLKKRKKGRSSKKTDG
ncbi:MAG: hypothetical protein IJK40_00410 [Clostridia bacterium]|nr:hypothetical protein [Clostridia bacterium]